MYSPSKKDPKVLVEKRAILTEDMSANKKYELTTNSGDETAKMWHSENGKKRFVGTCFIDPGNTNQDVTRANKYLQNSLGITNLYHSKQ